MNRTAAANPPPPLHGGRHVMDALDFARRLETSSRDLLVADPPWDLPGSGLFDKAAPYALQPMAYIGEVLKECRRALKPGRHAYVFAPSAACFPEALDLVLRVAGFSWVREVVWDKSRFSTPGLGRPWKNCHEPVFLVSNGPTRKSLTTGKWPSILSQRPVYTRTSKPPAIYRTFLEASTLPGEAAFDPFCGLNPLAEAAEQMGRSWTANDSLTPAEVEAQAKHRRRAGGRVRSGGGAP